MVPGSIRDQGGIAELPMGDSSVGPPRGGIGLFRGCGDPVWGVAADEAVWGDGGGAVQLLFDFKRRISASFSARPIAFSELAARSRSAQYKCGNINTYYKYKI